MKSLVDLGQSVNRGKKLAPNTYVSSINDIIKPKRNKVKEFIDGLDAEKFNHYWHDLQQTEN